MDFKFNSFASYISVVSGLIGTVALFKSHPFLAGISLLFVFSGIIYLIFVKYFYSHLLIKKGIKKILQKVKELNLAPDLIVSVSRSGATAAGMIAVNLGVQELLILSRKLTNSSNNKPVCGDKFLFTPYTKLNSNELNSKNILLVFMVIDTAETLRTGLEFLKAQGMDTKRIHIATICISPGSLKRWPNIISAYETSNIKNFLDNLPWIIDEYHHV
jgi:hypoxanthine phosphoribosyltransferase